MRRHALGVTAAGAIVAALALTTDVTVLQSRRVAAERDKAVEVRGFLMEMFGAAGGDQAADTLSARQLLDLQAERVGAAYAEQPDLRAEMMDVPADGYDRPGLAGEAEPWARAALDLRRDRLGGDHPDVAATVWDESLGSDHPRTVTLRSRNIGAGNVGGETPASRWQRRRAQRRFLPGR